MRNKQFAGWKATSPASARRQFGAKSGGQALVVDEIAPFLCQALCVSLAICRTFMTETRLLFSMLSELICRKCSTFFSPHLRGTRKCCHFLPSSFENKKTCAAI